MRFRSMSRLFRVLLPWLAMWMFCSGGHAAGALALRDGEQMTFRVGWGLFSKAGKIVVAAREETIDGAARLRVVTTTSTGGILKAFFPFEARSEAIFDPHTGLLLSTVETSRSKRKTTRQSLVFDHVKRTAIYTNDIEPHKNTVLDLPPGAPMDLIMCLVQTRDWQLQPGEKRDALVIFDDDLYALTLHALPYEQLSTPLGKFNTLPLEPRMEKTEPKGMFKRGSTVRVWIAPGETPLPVRFEVEFKFGAGVATLVNYHPPAAAGQTKQPTAEDETHPGA
jgi:hypothetical protein